jgi:hypothetical protein
MCRAAGTLHWLLAGHVAGSGHACAPSYFNERAAHSALTPDGPRDGHRHGHTSTPPTGVAGVLSTKLPTPTPATQYPIKDRGAFKKKEKENSHEKSNPGKKRPTDFPFPFLSFF